MLQNMRAQGGATTVLGFIDNGIIDYQERITPSNIRMQKNLQIRTKSQAGQRYNKNALNQT
jgi:hypothetical protein